ncbi:MAG TPA: 7-carboxy-7-deazaguanine synthase QueE [Candidatus Bathyarchaeia archaeon]|nr:7-carboxy-7-deazaguanine synthase QueE [Candidatus Bathyarchaeia archaeon]
MEKGYITELFSSFQGEGPYAGKRQIFIRFAGCRLSCLYCDTAYAREPKPGFCTVFGNEASSKNRSIKNPLPSTLVIDFVKELVTPDLHSISYTGGEPLLSSSVVKEIAKEAKSMHLKNFIETNGYSASAFASIADYFDFASIDIKLSNHQAVAEKDYGDLYRNAMDCIKIAADKGLETIVKVVVLKNISVKEIETICSDLADFNVKFVLQPVTVTPHLQSADVVPHIEELFELSETAGQFLQDVMVLPQVHKIMRIR